jgi:dihydrofolate reductase
MSKDVTMILAYGPDGVLGNHGALPWPSHKEDMRRFRQATMGGTVIMGRKTYESLGTPLKWRQNVVLTRKPDALRNPEVAVAKDLPAAIALAGNTPVFIIGGAAVYAAAMPFTNRILLTEMHGSFEGDVYFKIPFLHQWSEISREEWRGEGGHCDFVEYRLD